ncbi:MAG: transposase [Planctomycetota bacterium]
MERELWVVVRRIIDDVSRYRPDTAKHTFSTAAVVRVYFWAVLHDRPVSRACDPRRWDDRTRPARLPHQSTMSRRLRTARFADFLDAMTRRLRGRADALLQRLDGKPMFVPRHSQDRQATWGRGAGQMHRGYKLHAIWGDGDLPTAWEVRGLADDEKLVARELLPQVPGGGYVVGDAFYDSNPLHAVAAEHGRQLVAPRKHTHRGRGLGQRKHHPGRRRSLHPTEPGRFVDGAFGRALLAARRTIESRFGQLAAAAGGLTHLPPWVRGLRRVSQWVHVKLLLHAARRRVLRA